jgi:nucleoid-associated protein YgaU
MSDPAKASLVAHWRSGDQPYLVKFNPTEISFEKSVQVAELAIPGLDAPVLQFVRGQSEIVRMELFFDTTDQGMGHKVKSVTEETDQFYQLVKIEPSRHAPPICTFSWNDAFPGAHVSQKIGNQQRNNFQCIVDSIKQTFTLFSPEGVPLRAKVTLSLKQYTPLEDQWDKLRLNSPDRTHSHVVQRGETLAAIASRYYTDPGLWRAIAEHNNLDNPQQLTAGMFLNIPPLTT